MPTKPPSAKRNLNAAMSLLIQTQAQFLVVMAGMRKEFAAIRQELDAIKSVLVRHQTILEKLPEAVRDKIGFKQ